MVGVAGIRCLGGDVVGGTEEVTVGGGGFGSGFCGVEGDGVAVFCGGGGDGYFVFSEVECLPGWAFELEGCNSPSKVVVQFDLPEGCGGGADEEYGVDLLPGEFMVFDVGGGKHVGHVHYLFICFCVVYVEVAGDDFYEVYDVV